MDKLAPKEIALLKRLNTPAKVQDYLETLAPNFEEKGETCMSPRRVMREKKAHCMEGALFAALALSYHGHKPLLLDLKVINKRIDDDHVVALFREKGYWGAISKTNHAVLRYREPVYKTLRELALSYFHEYFTHKGVKTLSSFSRPFDLRKFNSRGWITDEKELWYLPKALDASPHVLIIEKSARKKFRKAHPVEIKAGKIVAVSKGK
jgi:hypothetical protein